MAWSADESCPQAPGLVEDAEAEAQATPLCSIYESVLEIDGAAETVPVNGDPCGDVDWEGYCHGTTVIWCQNEHIETYSGSATNRGTYFHGGILWHVKRRLGAGIDARFRDGPDLEFDGFTEKANYSQVSFLLGWNW